VLQILAFLASGPGGALIGIFIKIVAMILQSGERKAEAERDKRLGELGQIKEYQQQVHSGHEGQLKELKREIRLGKWSIRWSKWKTFSAVAYSPYSLVISFAIGMYALTISASILTFIYFGDAILITLDPTGASTDRSILYGLFTWSVETKTYVLTAGGAALYLLALVNFTATTAIIGTHRQRG
jgi:hypothetical protein